MKTFYIISIAVNTDTDEIKGSSPYPITLYHFSRYSDNKFVRNIAFSSNLYKSL